MKIQINNRNCNPARHLALALFAAALMVSGADAREVSPEQARRAVGHWLQQDRQPLGAKMGAANFHAPRAYRDAVGAPLFYVVQLDGGGFVITSADDEVEPIIAFSGSGEFSADEDNPLWALLHRDLPQRRDAARVRKFSPGGGTAYFTGAAAQRQRGKPFAKEPPAPEEQWAELDAAPPLPGTISPNDPRVDMLVQSRWNQSSTPPSYNYYTPKNYIAGCVATAGAQVMRYFQWPQTAVTPGTYTCYVDNNPVSLTMQGGVYNWSQMPLTTAQIAAEAQRQSIGKLLYDVGVAVSMSYSPNGSSAATSALAGAFKQRFNYASAVALSSRNIVSNYLGDAVLANLDAGAPVLFSIAYYNTSNQRSNGHAIVGDGYGYNNGTLYVHLNLGWGGGSDAWYNLPEIGTYYNFNTVDGVVFNIHPTETGEIISGRVLNSDGTPAGGAAVTVSGNGFLKTVTASDRGIYVARVPAGDTYVVSAASGGSASVSVTVGRESGVSYWNGSQWEIPVSNRWGKDLQLQPSASFTVSVSGPATVTVGENATFTASVSGGAGPYQYMWYDGATLKATTSTPAAQFLLTDIGERNIMVLVTDSGGRVATASRAVTVPGIALDVALNTSGVLSWTTGGDNIWLGQTGVTHDGVSAARSGAIADSQATWIKTTVSGTGVVSFWWKVFSEPNYDRLRFYIDGVVWDSISGEQDWVRREYTVSGAGSHELKWEYAKDGSEAGGDDAGWLDQVAWNTAASLTVTPSLAEASPDAATLTVSVMSGVAWTASTNASWLTVTPASGGNNGTLTVSVAANTGPARSGTLTVSGGGMTRTVSIIQAAAPVNTLLSVTPESQSVVAEASSFDVSIGGNLAWTASSYAAWLTVAPASGDNDGTLTVSVAANPGAARTGKLTVSGGGVTRAVTVTQAAGVVVRPPTADAWDWAGLSSKGLKLSAAITVPKGVKLAKGTKALYTWQRDGVTVASGSAKTFTAKTAGTYTLTLSYTTADGRQHLQTQNFGILELFAQPKTATLTVAQTTDTITNSALRGTSVVSGESLTLTVSVGTAGGGKVGPFRYVWYSGSKVVRAQQSSATTDTFTTPAYGDKTVGYKCVVELVAKDAKNKPLATAKSKDLKAKIILPPSAVTLKPSANPVKENGTLTLSATAKGTATLLFTWYKNGQQIATGSAKKFTKKPVTVSDAGVYYVVVSQDKTNRRAQSAPLTVSVQRADGTTVSGAQPQSAPVTASPSAAASTSSTAALLNNSAASTQSIASTVIPNLAPLTLSAGDVLTVSGSATREYLILSETQHSTGAYRYEWRDNLTAEFQDADAEAQLTLRFITIDGGIYELTVSGTASETGVFELRKK